MDGQPKNGAGCFVRGCLVVVIASIALAVILGVGGALLYQKVLNRFTAAEPVDVQVTAPTPAEYQVARTDFDRLRAAIANNREETIALSAADLNALVARDREFSGARGRVRFTMADSVMTLDLSVPVDSFPLPRLKNRWYNGTARFALNFEYDQFEIAPTLIEAGSWRVSDWILSPAFASSFNRSFSRSFHEAMQKNSQGAAVWSHIKSIKVEGDKLVIATRRVDG